MFLLDRLPSLRSHIITPPTDKAYVTLGINDLQSDTEKEYVRTVLKTLVKDPDKDIDTSKLFVCSVLAGSVISNLISASVRQQNGLLLLQVGNNYVDLAFDSKEKVYLTPIGTKLQISTRVDQPSGVTIPYFQLQVADYLASLEIRWVEFKEIPSTVVKNLFSLLVTGDADQLKLYVEQPITFPQPIYTLVRGCELDPNKGAHYRIIGVERKEQNKWGKQWEYAFYLDPSHVPQHGIYDSKGNVWKGNKFQANGNSYSFINGNYDQMKADLESGKNEYWLIISELKITGAKDGSLKHTVNHAILPRSMPDSIQQYRPVPPSVFVPCQKLQGDVMTVPMTVKSLTDQAKAAKA